MGKSYKIVVYVPVKNAQEIRDVLNELGAGNFANYEYASFSSKGTGRFKPLSGANPTVGKIGEIEEVEEEKIETVISKVSRQKIEQVYRELRDVHPYEEPAIEINELVDFN